MRHDDFGAIEQIGEAQRNRARGITEQHGPSICPAAQAQPQAEQAAGMAAAGDCVHMSDEARQQLHGREYDDTPSITALTQALRAMIHERAPLLSAQASPLFSI